MSQSLQLQAAIAWHKAGRDTAPGAPSVVLGQSLIDQILRARTLLMLLEPVPSAETEMFLHDTADLEQFRG
jgi:hypothetical protein